MGETMSNAEIFRSGAEKSTAQVAQALLRDGVVILDDVLPAAVVDRLSEKLQPHFDTSQSWRCLHGCGHFDRHGLLGNSS